MNENIHNPEIANLQLVANSFENKVIHGEAVAHDLNEFNTIYQELKDVIEQYKALYMETREEKTRRDYDAYLAQEIDFLNLMDSLLASLDVYHDVVGFIDGHEMGTEWENTRLIILYRNLERQLSILVGLQKSMDNSYSEQMRVLAEQYDAIRYKVIAAEAYIIEKASTEYNTMEVTTTEDKKKSFYTLDYDFFESLETIPDKIKYIELVLANIENIKGNKSIVNQNGVVHEISEKHEGRYLQYTSLLINLYNQFSLENERMIVPDKEFDLEYAASGYANLVISFYKLGREAMGADSLRVATVTNIDGKPLVILKTRMDKYCELVKIYQGLEKNVPYLNKNSGYFFSQNVESYEAIQKEKFVIFSKEYFLKRQESNPNIEKEKQRLSKKMTDIHIGEAFALYANLKVLFRASSLNENLSTLYTNIVMNPRDFMESTNYSDEEKKTLLADVYAKLTSFYAMQTSEKQTDLKLSLPLLEDKSSTMLQKMIGRIKEFLNRVPIVKKAVSLIKSIRKPKNKNAIRMNVERDAAYLAAHLGIVVFTGVQSFVQDYSLQVSPVVKARENSEVKSIETNQGVEEIIDKLWERRKLSNAAYEEQPLEEVYENAMEVVDENDNKSTVTYSYNGNLIELDVNSSEFEAKRVALEANGATLVEQNRLGGQRL